MPGRKISVNLAGRPLRNRRFFFGLSVSLILIFFAVAAISAGVFFSSRSREKALSASLAEVRKAAEEARQDRDAWTGQIREWAKTYRTTVAALNAVLVDKHFSWVDFWTRLEEALPSRCVVTQVTPLVARGGSLDVRFKMTCPTLDDLLAFIQGLNGQGFKNISVRQEAQLGGQWISEIMFTYERTD